MNLSQDSTKFTNELEPKKETWLYAIVFATCIIVLGWLLWVLTRASKTKTTLSAQSITEALKLD